MELVQIPGADCLLVKGAGENAVSLEEYMAPLPQLADFAELDKGYVALHVQKELHCNWKIAQEAFIEAYHGAITHPQTAKSNSVYNTQYDIFGHRRSRRCASAWTNSTGVCPVSI